MMEDYYGACVDTVTDESDTTNNCSSSVQVTVPQPVYPDLEVGVTLGERQQPGAGRVVHPVGDGEQPGRR